VLIFHTWFFKCAGDEMSISRLWLLLKHFRFQMSSVRRLRGMMLVVMALSTFFFTPLLSRSSFQIRTAITAPLSSTELDNNAELAVNSSSSLENAALSEDEEVNRAIKQETKLPPLPLSAAPVYQSKFQIGECSFVFCKSV
jgi:hypothetical protein